AFRTTSAATRTAPSVELLEEMTHGPVMLRHLLGVPSAVGRAYVTAGADLAAQSGPQELLTGIQPRRPKFDTRASGWSGRCRGRQFGRRNQAVRHGHSPAPRIHPSGRRARFAKAYAVGAPVGRFRETGRVTRRWLTRTSYQGSSPRD